MWANLIFEKKFKEFAKKIDKMSIRDWGTSRKHDTN